MTLSDRQTRRRDHDARRSIEQPWRAWYSSPEWQQSKKDQLKRRPWCERHERRGQKVKATVVNHRIPHRGRWALFIDPNNHESVCKSCHDSAIKREEMRGTRIGVDLKGRPTDPDHPWNRRG